MNKQLTFLITAIFLLTLFAQFVNAAYKQNTDVNFKVGCKFLNCSQRTYTVSVEDPDSILILNEAPTSIQQGYLNFTLNSSQTSKNGIYNVFLIGTGSNPFYHVENFYHSEQIVITPNGETPTEANAIFYIGLLLVLLIGFIIIAYFGVSTENIIVKTFSIGFGYLFLIAISFVAWNMAADFLTSSPFLTDFLYHLFIVLTVGFFPLLIILFAYGIYMMLTMKEIKDMIERGIPESEAAERVRWKK